MALRTERDCIPTSVNTFFLNLCKRDSQWRSDASVSTVQFVLVRRKDKSNGLVERPNIIIDCTTHVTVRDELWNVLFLWFLLKRAANMAKTSTKRQ